LAPNDFFLFPRIKNKLRDQHFSTSEEAVDAFKMHVLRRYLNRSGKSVLKIGSNACKSVLIFMENTLKTNKAIFND